MIRQISSAALLLVCALTASGQKSYGTIELSSKNLKTLQRFLIGDTVVTFYRDAQPGSQINPFTSEHWVLIAPDGEKQHLVIAELYGKEKVAVMRKGDELLFYFAEEVNKKAILKMLAYNPSTSKKTVIQCGTIPDELLVTAIDETLTFFYWTRSNELGLMRIDAGRVIEDVKYVLPPNTIDRRSGIAFIEEGSLITAGQAFQPVKIYRSNGRIVITHDKNDYSFNNKNSVTHWTTIDTRSGKVASISIPEPGHTQYKSIWHDGMLYRIIKDKGFHVKVFDGENLISNFSIPYDVAYAGQTGMLRDDAGRRVFNNRNVRDVMDNLGKPFIVVQKLDSTNILLKVGTQKEVSHGHTPILPMSSLAGLFVSLTISSVSHAIADESYVHHYFYLRGNISDGFSYTNETRLLEQKIDQYELFDPKTRIDYRYKSYLRSKDQTIAFYMREKTRQLELVKFQ